MARTVFLLNPSRWLISRYDWPSPTSFNTLGAKRSALTRWPGRRPNTTPRLRAAAMPERTRSRSKSRSNSAFCRAPQNAEFERAMLKERTKAGLDAARKEGRPPKLKPQQRQEIVKLVTRGKKTAADAARL